MSYITKLIQTGRSKFMNIWTEARKAKNNKGSGLSYYSSKAEGGGKWCKTHAKYIGKRVNGSFYDQCAFGYKTKQVCDVESPAVRPCLPAGRQI